ncbi:MAG TPA: iron-containing alcohol dehydrogenase [Chloroflexota bacterium]|nr:iron-containing alcohol dehydrogenase [Chloroflexota bacterium]
MAAVFRAPRKVVTGRGCSQEIGALAAELGMRRALVVIDPQVRTAGVAEAALASLGAAGLALTLYEGVHSEPVLAFVDEAMAALRDGGGDGLVAIGGGSVIDTAKAAAALTTNGGRLPDYEGIDRFTRPGLPLIAVPTTAGTGSEVTRVAVVTDQERGVKMMLMADTLLPTVAVDDPLLTVSAPPGATAAAGLDALTHAIEAYVSRRAQPLTDTLALAAIRAIVVCLPRAWRDGQDLEAREGMMIAQLQAGLAFSNSSVALIHGMARPLGAHFGVPHGMANAMLLPVVMRFSLPGATARYAAIGEAMGAGAATEAERAEGAVVVVERLARELGVPSLADFGIDEAHFQRVKHQMARDALASGSPANNPRTATAEEIAALYDAAYSRA